MSEKQRPKPPEGRRFKKGQSGNPSGRPKIPEDLKRASRLTADEFLGLCNKFLRMNLPDLLAVVGNPKQPNTQSSMLEMLVASIITKAVNEGDQRRLDFLLDRLLGKIVTPVSVQGEVGGPPTVILNIPSNGRDQE